MFYKSEKILDVDDSRIIFTSPQNEYELTIIEIKEQEQLKINYIIEIDENINIKVQLIKSDQLSICNRSFLSFYRFIDLD